MNYDRIRQEMLEISQDHSLLREQFFSCFRSNGDEEIQHIIHQTFATQDSPPFILSFDDENALKSNHTKTTTGGVKRRTQKAQDDSEKHEDEQALYAPLDLPVFPGFKSHEAQTSPTQGRASGERTLVTRTIRACCIQRDNAAVSHKTNRFERSENRAKEQKLRADVSRICKTNTPKELSGASTNSNLLLRKKMAVKTTVRKSLILYHLFLQHFFEVHRRVFCIHEFLHLSTGNSAYYCGEVAHHFF